MNSDPAARTLEIRSPANERFKRLLTLAGSARSRRQHAQTLVEGEHLAQAWLDTGAAPVDEVILPLRSAAKAPLESLCARLARRTLVLEDSLFDRLSQVEHGPGPIFVLPVDRHDLAGPIDTDAIYLDGLQDPGNAGTLLRSAAAFGVRTVLASPSTVDLWSPKVLRAGMGAHFSLRVIVGLSASKLIAAIGHSVLTAADPRGKISIDEARLRVPRVWLFGSEGAGLSPDFSSVERLERLRIPHHPTIESLNVAVAASICLYEQARQRDVASPPRST